MLDWSIGGISVAVVLAWIANYIVKPLVPVICDALRTYVQDRHEGWRREALLTLIRAAEERFGPGQGAQKHAWVLSAATEANVPVTDDEIRAGARLVTKEQVFLPGLDDVEDCDAAP